jgi:DNA-binding transcriptional MerR regulator
MAGAAARSNEGPQRVPQRGLLSIGQVLARLSPEFPDVSPSKVRFLEEQRLICPARTESGYRKFSPTDLERLRLILSLQRDQYLPLKVIRKYLTELDAGTNPALPGSGATPTGPITTILGSEKRWRREELIRLSGATPTLLQEAVSAGLIMAADVFGEDSMTVLRALVELQGAGIEPRHLRSYRSAAEREIGLIDGAVAATGRRNDPSGRAHAQEKARELAEQLDIVRSSVFRAAVARHTV